MSDFGLCVDCKKISTTNTDSHTNEYVCGSCSNTRYFKKVGNGELVELKIDMTKVNKSTLTQIRYLIEKDIEEFNKLK